MTKPACRQPIRLGHQHCTAAVVVVYTIKFLNPRGRSVRYPNMGRYLAVRNNQGVSGESETSSGGLDTSGVDWCYVPWRPLPRSQSSGKITLIKERNDPNSNRQLLTLNATVGLTIIADDRYVSIVQEYELVDDYMHPISGSRARSNNLISSWKLVCGG